MTKVSADITAQIASMARLTLSKDELSRMSEDMNKMLNLFEKLNTVNVEGIDRMYHPQSLAQRTRKDIVTEVVNTQVFEAIAPSMQDNCYTVPNVLETKTSLSQDSECC